MSTDIEPVKDSIATEDFQALCTAIGFVEVNWALFEQSLDHMVITIHRDLGGATFVNELPRSYSNKVKFLRKAFSRIPSLQSLKDNAKQVLEKSKELSKHRHDLTHGVVTHTELKDGRYNFSKIDYSGTEHQYRDFVFDPNTFPRLAQELLDLGTLTASLGLKVEQITQC